MTIRTTYIAWDDTQFEEKEKCEQYEAEMRKMFDTFLGAYHFYNKDMVEQKPTVTELEEIYEWILEQYETCEYVVVTQEIPADIVETICSYDGIDFPNEHGIYFYSPYGWQLKA